MKHCWMIMVALLLAMGAKAQNNRLYVEDFEICPDSMIIVHVNLANQDETRGLQFNLTLPDGLMIVEHAVTALSAKYNMYGFGQKNGNVWTLGMYPMGAICLPPDTAAVVELHIHVAPQFRGGKIIVWKCRGSTIDNKTIYMDGDTATVTVPRSMIIGIPVDQHQSLDNYFNLQGQLDSIPAREPMARSRRESVM